VKAMPARAAAFAAIWGDFARRAQTSNNWWRNPNLQVSASIKMESSPPSFQTNRQKVRILPTAADDGGHSSHGVTAVYVCMRICVDACVCIYMCEYTVYAHQVLLERAAKDISLKLETQVCTTNPEEPPRKAEFPISTKLWIGGWGGPWVANIDYQHCMKTFYITSFFIQLCW